MSKRKNQFQKRKNKQVVNELAGATVEELVGGMNNLLRELTRRGVTVRDWDDKANKLGMIKFVKTKPYYFKELTE